MYLIATNIRNIMTPHVHLRTMVGFVSFLSLSTTVWISRMKTAALLVERCMYCLFNLNPRELVANFIFLRKRCPMRRCASSTLSILDLILGKVPSTTQRFERNFATHT